MQNCLLAKFIPRAKVSFVQLSPLMQFCSLVQICHIPIIFNYVKYSIIMLKKTKINLF